MKTAPRLVLIDRVNWSLRVYVGRELESEWVWEGPISASFIESLRTTPPALMEPFLTPINLPEPDSAA